MTCFFRYVGTCQNCFCTKKSIPNFLILFHYKYENNKNQIQCDPTFLWDKSFLDKDRMGEYMPSFYFL